MKSIIDNVKKNFGQIKVRRTAEGDVAETQIRTVDDAASYLKAVQAEAERLERGEIKGDANAEVRVTTATEVERRQFLNYCINEMPDKYIKHKILMFLMVNPIYDNAQTGRGVYMSRRAIADFLTKKCGYKVFEAEITAIEREGIEIAKQTLASSRDHGIPLIGAEAKF